jgi:hypothetical protein
MRHAAAGLNDAGIRREPELARAGLQAGQELLPDAAKQSLDYLGTLDPYVTQQLAAYCGAP